MKRHHQVLKYCRDMMNMEDALTASVLRKALEVLTGSPAGSESRTFSDWLATLDTDTPRDSWRIMNTEEVLASYDFGDMTTNTLSRELSRVFGPASGNRRINGKKRARRIPPVKIDSLI